MSLTWGDWLRFIVTPLVVAGFTAIVATRNAKKTPHERLKNLVDIHKHMPDDLDIRNVVRKAIARELVDFDRRIAADQRGFWAGIRERIAQREFMRNMLVALILVCVGEFSASSVNPDLLGKPVTLVIVFAPVVAILVGARVVSREERRTLNMDRAAAEIAAQFSRAQIHSTLKHEDFDSTRGDFYFRTARRLADLGVFDNPDPVGVADQPDLQVYRFRLTQIGKEAFAMASADVDRQHAAKWAELARENGEGDDDPGRGAPGA